MRTSRAWPKAKLGNVLTRSKERVEIRPARNYKQVTVRLWGEGVILRNEVSGMKIRARTRYVAHEGHFILSRIDARNGAFGIVQHVPECPGIGTDHRQTHGHVFEQFYGIVRVPVVDVRVRQQSAVAAQNE